MQSLIETDKLELFKLIKIKYKTESRSLIIICLCTGQTLELTRLGHNWMPSYMGFPSQIWSRWVARIQSLLNHICSTANFCGVIVPAFIHVAKVQVIALQMNNQALYSEAECEIRQGNYISTLYEETNFLQYFSIENRSCICFLLYYRWDLIIFVILSQSTPLLYTILPILCWKSIF